MKDNSKNPLAPVQAIIEEKIIEAKDVFSLRLSLPNGLSFLPKPGQFNMLGIPGIGEAPFSFSSLDSGGKGFTHTIRTAGNVVNAVSKLDKGDSLTIRGPYGKCWPLDVAEGKNLIIVAGGIGMPPLRPVVYYVLQNRNKFKKICLLYGAKTIEELLYKDELENWSKQIPVLLSADKLTQSSVLPVRRGLVTTLFDQLDVPMADTVTFTCGPQVMMKFVAAELIMKGHKPDKIFVSMERGMKCGIGHCGHCQIGAKFVCKDGPVFSLPEINRFPESI
jgi:sulfhydrogenase subunit gamma (sulfur reductase)